MAKEHDTASVETLLALGRERSDLLAQLKHIQTAIAMKDALDRRYQEVSKRMVDILTMMDCVQPHNAGYGGRTCDLFTAIADQQKGGE